MKCPYCSEEMEIGVIPSRLELAWFKGVKRPALSAKFHKEAVVLSKMSFMNGSAVAAYLCKNCNKVIIDYSIKKSDYNER